MFASFEREGERESKERNCLLELFQRCVTVALKLVVQTIKENRLITMWWKLFGILCSLVLPLPLSHWPWDWPHWRIFCFHRHCCCICSVIVCSFSGFHSKWYLIHVHCCTPTLFSLYSYSHFFSMNGKQKQRHVSCDSICGNEFVCCVDSS